MTMRIWVCLLFNGGLYVPGFLLQHSRPISPTSHTYCRHIATTGICQENHYSLVLGMCCLCLQMCAAALVCVLGNSAEVKGFLQSFPARCSSVLLLFSASLSCTCLTACNTIFPCGFLCNRATCTVGAL